MFPILISYEPVASVSQFGRCCLEVGYIRAWHRDFPISKQQCCDGKRSQTSSWHSLWNIGNGTKFGHAFGYCHGRGSALCLCSTLNPSKGYSQACRSCSFLIRSEACLRSRRDFNFGSRCYRPCQKQIEEKEAQVRTLLKLEISDKIYPTVFPAFPF